MEREHEVTVIETAIEVVVIEDVTATEVVVVEIATGTRLR